MAINFDKALGVHQYTLGVRSQRAEVLSSNIANADTPQYKARDIDFDKALASASRQQNGLKMAISNRKHFDLEALSQQTPDYRAPTQPDTGDGNTVDMQQEQSAFMQNSLEYQMSLGFLDSGFKGLKKAIRGD
ncbi:flagellar basal body rod protein FlgB [Shewanella surugensis]|uniref:Flagellar basal body rod protein FlgB n=1 Tax=Shewanella surugensis TaxID=212020 RepID=A0ABT0LD79_9GAMM|nr:flagellar basal body rod protein FlgB [Shewanella surugensis]MCL1125445.1 flagellar basal body rod protein FlgB [Shewanella surugensis]